MTTLTGSTAMRAGLRADVKPPPFSVAVGGAAVQMATLLFVWHRTSASECLRSPLGCTDAWGKLLLFVLGGVFAIWAASVVSARFKGFKHSDASLVDRLWSLQPVAYAWYCYASNPTQRGLVIACVSSVWGARLTYNFAAKGGYSGGEDYRWAEVRTWYPGWKYEVFHLVFVCGFQQLLILAFSLPAVAAMQSTEPFGGLDFVAAFAFLAMVCGEGVADAQMLKFQREKYRRLGAGEKAGPFAKGFLDSGLYAVSRHPNYFCEVGLWWAFYLFAVSATASVLNWTGLGALYLTLLFVPPGASIDVTEHLAQRKYEHYAGYQQRVSRFVPWFPAQQGDCGLISDASRRFYVCFFAVHVPMTLFVDAQAVLDQRLFPAPLRSVLAWHVQVNGDALMAKPPPWFKAVVWAEVLLQLPFFCAAVKALCRREDAQLRPFALVYGAHTATTLLPILAHIFTDAGRTPLQRFALGGIYAPFLFVPLALVCSFFQGARRKAD
mmetsp:Transcript_25253/g.86614  ORF Transcript_25253/g.86614 Transcript_25253/m.86614 type:complete len:494 (-) Transcript_25253:103-1584(-)